MMKMKDYRDEKAEIYLRPISREDTDLIVKWRNSEFVRNRFLDQRLFTRESHEAWLKNKVDTGQVVQTIICDLRTDKPYGSVYIRDIDPVNRKAEYGIFIGDESALGKGIGTAAAKLMLRYCFEEAGLHRVYLRVQADNIRAIRSYEKAGFEREGLLREDACINGKFVDILWMARVNQYEEN